MPAAKKANVLSDKTIIRAGRNVACLKIDIKYIQKEVENMRRSETCRWTSKGWRQIEHAR